MQWPGSDSHLPLYRNRRDALTIVTGHWGEVVLFYLDRAAMLSGAAKLPRTISEYFRQHVYVTPSGLFSHRYLNWALEVLGAEHILFATDYPFAPAAPRDCPKLHCRRTAKRT